MTEHTKPTRKFNVKVGHAQVEVEGSSPEEAIGRARMKLSQDMPRLYDVIHKIDDTQFRVDEAH